MRVAERDLLALVAQRQERPGVALGDLPLAQAPVARTAAVPAGGSGWRSSSGRASAARPVPPACSRTAPGNAGTRPPFPGRSGPCGARFSTIASSANCRSSASITWTGTSVQPALRGRAQPPLAGHQLVAIAHRRTTTGCNRPWVWRLSAERLGFLPRRTPGGADKGLLVDPGRSPTRSALEIAAGGRRLRGGRSVHRVAPVRTGEGRLPVPRATARRLDTRGRSRTRPLADWRSTRSPRLPCQARDPAGPPDLVPVVSL